MHRIDATAIRLAIEHYRAASGPPAPGFALAVCIDGDMVWSTTEGVANLEHDVPVTTSSVFHVASVSKQFTAVCIARLVDDGKISLQDDVRSYIPELPIYGDPIRVHHLVHHTSGLRDDLWIQDFAGWRDDAWVSASDALDLIFRQQRLSFPTGTRFFYSNAGYSLLALIVERVSGLSFERFADTCIFTPLGMRNSRFASFAGELVPNRATAYSHTPQGQLRTLSPEVGLNGAIGLLTTVEDFGKWFAYLGDQISNGTETGLLMQQNGTLNNGKQVNYSLGFFTGEHHGHNVIRHGGSHGGYRSHMLFLPEDRVGIVCFANSDDVSAGGICETVADVILGTSAVVPGGSVSIPSASKALLRPGVYFEESWGAWLHIREQNGRLVLIDTVPGAHPRW